MQRPLSGSHGVCLAIPHPTCRSATGVEQNGVPRAAFCQSSVAQAHPGAVEMRRVEVCSFPSGQLPSSVTTLTAPILCRQQPGMPSSHTAGFSVKQFAALCLFRDVLIMYVAMTLWHRVKTG